MKVSDYVVEYLIKNEITDVFGYPGGMVTHLMDSFSRYAEHITAHVAYNEQGAAMAACGFAQASGKVGVAYATSGPGATNMITGICNAYMDSIPTLFITGQVNSFEQKGDRKVRQRGFQETDIISMVKSCTKYAVSINDAGEIKSELDKAFFIAGYGRKGPVLLDIAMDVFRAEIEPGYLSGTIFDGIQEADENSEEMDKCLKMIKNSKRPVFLLGKGFGRDDRVLRDMDHTGIPVVSSMIAVDLKADLNCFYGFVGAYGDRTANFVVEKSDLVIAVGARLDIRQVGSRRENFAPNAGLIRVDIDEGELAYKVHEDEVHLQMDSAKAIKQILKILSDTGRDYSKWAAICDEIKQSLEGMDEKAPNRLVKNISSLISEDAIITTDVGQNQVWVAQSFGFKKGQRAFFSGGHGAMGYSLPAAIGAAIATGKKVYSFNGDGGIQMNIQELQVIVRERLPIKVLVFNNNALGMIRHFQEMYFDSNYFQTTAKGGFTSPNFEKIAAAYGLEYFCIEDENHVSEAKDYMNDDNPALIEVKLSETTYIFPKLKFGMPNSDQEPLIARDLYKRLMALDERQVEAISISESWE